METSFFYIAIKRNCKLFWESNLNRELKYGVLCAGVLLFQEAFPVEGTAPSPVLPVPGTSTTATAITWCQGKEQQIVKGTVSGSMELALQREVLFSSYVHFKATMKEE